jgi:amidase
VADVRTLFTAMAAPDPDDPSAAPVSICRPPEDAVRKLRIGILESEDLGTPTAETREAVNHTGRALLEQGFKVEPVRIRGLERAVELWWFFFGPVIGYLLRTQLAGQKSVLSAMLREYLAVTDEEPPLTLDRFVQACIERDTIRAGILRQLEDVPVLLSPVSSGPAFHHGEGNWKLGDGDGAYRQTMRYAQWLNLAGLPGAVIPVSQSLHGLPIGVQIIGRPYEDEQVLEVAERIEQACGGWRQPPI